MELSFATSPSPSAFAHLWLPSVMLFITSVFTVKFGRNPGFFGRARKRIVGNVNHICHSGPFVKAQESLDPESMPHRLRQAGYVERVADSEAWVPDRGPGRQLC